MSGQKKYFAKKPFQILVTLLLASTLPACAGAVSPVEIKSKVEVVKGKLPVLAAAGIDLKPYLKRMNQVKKSIDRKDLKSASRKLDAIIDDINQATPENFAKQSSAPRNEKLNHEFYNEELIELKGFGGNAMEIGISPDRKYILFNDRQKPNKDMHWAKRINDRTYQYKGKVKNTVTRLVDGTPSFDSQGNLYYISMGNIPRPVFKGVYRSTFENGKAVDPKIVEGIYVGKPGWISLDPDISWNGKYLFYTEGFFDGGPVPRIMNIRGTKNVDGRFARLDDRFFRNINTNMLEYAPAISSNGLELFFTRAGKVNGRLGILGIYVSKRNTLEEPFGKPEKIAAITGTVEAPALSPDEKQIYYHRMDGNRYKVYRVSRKASNVD